MILHLIHLTWYFHIDYHRIIKIHSSVNKFLSSLMRKHDVYNLERESKQQGKTSAIFIFYYSQQKLKMFEKWKSFFGKFSDTSCLFHETLISFWKFYITEFYLFSMYFLLVVQIVTCSAQIISLFCCKMFILCGFYPVKLNFSLKKLTNSIS